NAEGRHVVHAGSCNVCEGGPSTTGRAPRLPPTFVGVALYVNLTQDHCDGLIRDHLGEEVVAQASS
ncbi:hypothetical protein, partial [Mycobacterium kiyosense]|uniref:hypothetical protein n=1 Tax=Mycobacterium kiyosense TaxID=2871094 RepID=UPI002231507F